MSLDNYLLNESRIIEARNLFFEKGIVKRDVVQDQIAFSWLRNKYKNIDADQVVKTAEMISFEVFANIDKIIKLDMKSHWVGLYNASGILIRYYGNRSITNQMCEFDINEEANGNNGIGAAYNGSDYSIVYGHEHYHTQLTHYITIGIPVNVDQTIGIVLDLTKANSKDIENCETLDVDELVKMMKQKTTSKSSVPDLYFYRTSAPAFANLCQQIDQLRAQAKVYTISGLPGSGKKACAKYIHETSSFPGSALVICDVLHHTEEAFKQIIDTVEEGTLYIENLEWSSVENQYQLLKKIDCKSINSKPAEVSKEKGLTVVVGFVDRADREVGFNLIIPGLQSRLKVFQLTIPRFTAIGVDFKSFLQREIDLLMSKRGKTDISIDSELLRLFTDYDWPYQYKELERAIDLVAYCEGRKIDWISHPVFIIMRENLLQSSKSYNLKERERLIVLEALKSNNCNVLKTSKALGITRTTLYKKIDEYGIDLKCIF